MLGFPLVDGSGFVLQDENGVYLDDIIVTATAIIGSKSGATGAIIVDINGFPIVGSDGYVEQDPLGILLDDVAAVGSALSTGRFGATGDIIYDEDGPLMTARRHLSRFVLPQPAIQQVIRPLGVGGSAEFDDIGTLLPLDDSVVNTISFNLTIPSSPYGGVRVSTNFGTTFTVSERTKTILSIHLFLANGEPFDLSGWRVTWQVFALGRRVIVYKTSKVPDNIMISNREGGSIRVYLDERDTSLPRNGGDTFRYELNIEDDEQVVTVAAGTIRIQRDSI
jgi:hypothetical protein